MAHKMDKTTTIQFPSDPALVNESFEKVMDVLTPTKLNEDDEYNLKLCFTEAFVNAIRHGNKSNPDLMVEVEILKSNDRFEIAVKDQGPGYDYKNIDDCTHEKNLTKNGGRGVFLIKQLMDEVKFENNGSRIRMIKRLKQGGEHEHQTG